jgi:hypothetical protein
MSKLDGGWLVELEILKGKVTILVHAVVLPHAPP